MQPREIHRAKRDLKTAGTPADQLHMANEFIDRIGEDLKNFEEESRAHAAEFRGYVARWTTTAVDESVIPHVLLPDREESVEWFAGALAALLGECGLAYWIFFTQNLKPWLGPASAIIITIVLHALVVGICSDRERPKRLIDRLRRFCLAPSAVVFGISLVLGVFARYAGGALALVVRQYFPYALWAGTLSLMLMSAALLGGWRQLRWSIREHRSWAARNGLVESNEVFLAELKRDFNNADRAPSAGQVSQTIRIVNEADHDKNRSGSTTDGSRNSGAGPIVTMIVVGFLLCRCTHEPLTYDETDAQGATLTVVQDTSGSLETEPLRQACQNIRAEMPSLLDELNVTRVQVCAFDQDGWEFRVVAEQAIKPLRLAKRASPERTEADAFGNLGKAAASESQQNWQQRQDKLRAERLSRIETAISQLSVFGQPLPDRAVKQTDITGSLRHIAATQDSVPTYYILITDLADTAQSAIPSIPPPAQNVHALVLLVPSRPSDAKQTLGASLPGAEQYDLRLQQARKAAPWLNVQPYFAHDLLRMFKNS